VRIGAESFARSAPGRALIKIVAAVVLFYVAYQLSQLILVGDTSGLFYIVIAIVAAGCIVAVLNDWRTGTYLFFTWIFFEDFFRKYLGNNMAIYFGKDILAAVIYLSFFMAVRRNVVKIYRPPFYVPLVVLIWFGIGQIFNPASTSIFFGLMGIKLYFYYVPFFFVLYALMDTEAAIRKFYPLLMTMILIVSALGIAQAIIGHTFLNPTHIQADIRDLSMAYRTSPLTGTVVYRPTSVFVSTGRFTFMLSPAWLFTFGYYVYLLLRSKEQRLFTSLVLSVTTVAVALCASRGAVMWTLIDAIVCVAAFLWGCPWRQGQIVRLLRSFQRAAIVVGLGLALTAVFYPKEIGGRLALYTETLDPRSSASELGARTGSYPIRNFLGAFNYPRWPYGYGIGTASLGTQYVARIMKAKPMGVEVESGFGTIVLELGIVGLFIWIGASLAIVISAWRVVYGLRNTFFFPIGFVIFWYALVQLLLSVYTGFSGYEDFILNSLLWASLGILYRLPTIFASEKVEAVRRATIEPAGVS